MMKMEPAHCGPLPVVHHPRVIMRKSQANFDRAKGNSTKYLTRPLKTVKVIKTKSRWRNCHSQEELEEIRQLKLVYCPGWDPGTEKGHS
jgi:hypothetical protein